MNELNNIDWSALNRNDSYLIDLNSTIFIWNGRNANKYEKLQAMYRAKQFRDERNDNCNIVVVEDGEEKDLPKDELKLFESKFPLKDKVSKMRTEAVNTQMDDLKFEKDLSSYLKLYKYSLFKILSGRVSSVHSTPKCFFVDVRTLKMKKTAQ